MKNQIYLIEWHCKSSVDIMTMKDCHSDYSTNKMEVGKMIRVHSTVWIDLKCIDIIPKMQDIRMKTC